jgi:hypothetical protein
LINVVAVRCAFRSHSHIRLRQKWRNFSSQDCIANSLASSHDDPSGNQLTQSQFDGAFNLVFDSSCNRNFLHPHTKPLACAWFSANEMGHNDHGMKTAKSTNQMVPRSGGLETDKSSKKPTITPTRIKNEYDDKRGKKRLHEKAANRA